MYKIAIIEDEDFTRLNLVKIITKEIEDFEVVDEFSDACFVLDKIEQYDVILSDIKMAHVSGLELAKIIYENKLSTKIILLSAYNDFEYASQAIGYGVAWYLTKPFNVNSMKEAFAKVKEMLDSENRVSVGNRKDFYANIGMGIVYRGDLKKLAAHFEPDLDIENDEVEICEIVISDFEDFIETKWQYNKDNLIYALYTFFENDAPFIVRVLTRINDTVFIMTCDKGTGMSKSFVEERIAEFNTIFGTCISVRKRITCKNFYEMYDSDMFADEVTVVNERSKLLYSLIMEKKVDDAINMTLKIHHSESVLKMVQKWLEDGDVGVPQWSGLETNEWIRQAVSAIEKKEKMTKVINKVKDYVYENYSRNISLEEIAQMVYFNQAYLGRLFKKETGESFNDFLLSVRMEKAKELLKDPGYKVYEIGECVGYKTTQYFYKVFKLYYGVTPSEYRKQMLLS